MAAIVWNVGEDFDAEDFADFDGDNDDDGGFLDAADLARTHSWYSSATGGAVRGGGVAAPPPPRNASEGVVEPHPELLTVLLRAAENGYAPAVLPALCASAELAHDVDLLTGLLTACASKPVPAAQRLREPRAPLAPLAALKYSPAPLLHAAAALGHVRRVAELLHVGRSLEGLLDLRDACGRTAIMVAAGAGQPRALEVLLRDPRATAACIAAESLEPMPGSDGWVHTAFSTACCETQKAVTRGLSGSACAECAVLLFATGAVDPSVHCGGGSGYEVLRSTHPRAELIRTARPTALRWALGVSAIRNAVGAAMLADPRCTAEAIKAHWYRQPTSAFRSVLEAVGELRGSQCDPPTVYPSHKAKWWHTTLAGGAPALAALSEKDRDHVNAHKLLRAMLLRLRPRDVVMHQSAGPFDDSPGHPITAEELVSSDEGIGLADIAPIEWAQAPAAGTPPRRAPTAAAQDMCSRDREVWGWDDAE